MVPEGTLFGNGVAVRIKHDLLTRFNLPTVVRLPNGVSDSWAARVVSGLWQESWAQSAWQWVSDATGRPEIGGEVVRGRLLGQPLANLLILFGGEESPPARCGFGSQTGVACGPVSGHPLGHGDAVNAQSNGDSGLRLSVRDQLHGSVPHGFQIGSRSFASHGGRVTYVACRIQ